MTVVSGHPVSEAAELEWLSNFVDDLYPDIANYPPVVQAVMAAAARNGGGGGRQAISGQENSSSSCRARSFRPYGGRGQERWAPAWRRCRRGGSGRPARDR